MKHIALFILLSFSAVATEYAIMIDAGSSGSRVLVYDTLSLKLIGTQFKIKPGIAQLHDKPKKILSYLEPLISFAKKQTGDLNADNTTITLQATGGVRALNANQQKQLMLATQDALSTFGFKSAKAEVISGYNEGVYQWYSIQHLGKKPMGLVELGGASLQIAFSKNHELYSISYDGLGETSAWNQYGSACKNLDYLACRRSLRKKITMIKRPDVQGDFYLIDNFEKFARKTKLKTLSSKILDTVGPKICSAPKTCFMAAYISILLEKIGFKPNQELTPIEELGGIPLSWTLGSLIMQLRQRIDIQNP